MTGRVHLSISMKLRDRGIAIGQFLARRLRHVIKRYTPFRTPTAFHGVPPRSASHAEEKLSPCRAAIYVYILTHEYRETSDRRVCNLPLPGFVPCRFHPQLFLLRAFSLRFLRSKCFDQRAITIILFYHLHFSIPLSLL